MKYLNYQPEDFRQLTAEEAFSCSGGGFAYDAGRFLRYWMISGGTIVGSPNAICDFIANKY